MKAKVPSAVLVDREETLPAAHPGHPPRVVRDRVEVVFAQIDAAWEVQSPEPGLCLKANHLHDTRGAVLFFPEAVCGPLREALAGQIRPQEPAKEVS